MDFIDYAKRDLHKKRHPWGPDAAFYIIVTSAILIPLALALQLV